LLVLDEIQKVTGWSVAVKRLWDEERRRPDPLSVVLLGSSSLQLHQVMSESLAGRVLLHPSMHWRSSSPGRSSDGFLELLFLGEMNPILKLKMKYKKLTV
jgi:hypothetical protein